MKRLMVALIIVALAPLRALGGTPPGNTCTQLPVSMLSVRLNTLDPYAARHARAIQSVVDETWTALGMQFRWTSDNTTTPLWIHLISHAPRSAAPDTLALVQFKSGVAEPAVFVFVDSVTDWVMRAEAERFRTTTRTQRPVFGDAAELTAIALGYVAAHEIGHYLLGNKRHSKVGLMQATYERVENLRAPRNMFLDEASRHRLDARLREGETCRAAMLAAAR
jgi:hypothetical protein